MSISLPDYPVNAVLPQLEQALQSGNAAVLVAPPGSGKTTIAPLHLLASAPGWLRDQRILMLEPRRLAARACATRMARLLGEDPGGRVGYQVRFERRVGKGTRIEVVTEGILTRRLQSDPELQGIGLLVFDEFHERNLQGDLGLALALDVQAGLRPDLRILVMSATLDAAAVARVLGDAPVIEGAGRSFPVALRYADRTSLRPDLEQVSGAVRDVLQREPGDLLVFLPGAREIRYLAEQLGPLVGPDVDLCPLYGDLGMAAQEDALKPRTERRRVVLATDIAETSLTIEGIATVVDAGWCREPRFDPNRGVSSLQTVRVSQASADQRAGRAGRLGPGSCYRLWSEHDHAGLQAQRAAEISKTDLAPLVLELALWGVHDPASLQWLDKPPAPAWAQAVVLLKELGALGPDGRITPAGQTMVGMGAHPRLAHLLYEGVRRGNTEMAADLAALLSERDPLRRTGGSQRAADLELRLRILRAWRQHGAGAARRAGFDVRALERIDRASREFRRRFGGGKGGDDARLEVGELLALAYPDRVARRRAGADGAYLMASGRGVRLPPDDELAARDWLVIASLDAGRRDGRVYLAASLDPGALRELLGERIEWHDRLDWDDQRGRVVARKEERLGALVLASRPLDTPDPEAVRARLLQGLRGRGLVALTWSEAATGLRQRVIACRAWFPGEGWPDWSDEALSDSLEHWLGPYLDGLRSVDEVRRLDLHALLLGTLEWSQRQALDELAPVRMAVPSGRSHRIDYADPAGPVLAVQLQELFGLGETPCVARGAVPLVLHLLSPARRPVQVTRDLRGFWENTYAEVRKELRIRYAKHYWPDDPWDATATAHPRRRR